MFETRRTRGGRSQTRTLDQAAQQWIRDAEEGPLSLQYVALLMLGLLLRR